MKTNPVGPEICEGNPQTTEGLKWEGAKWTLKRICPAYNIPLQTVGTVEGGKYKTLQQGRSSCNRQFSHAKYTRSNVNIQLASSVAMSIHQAPHGGNI